MMVYLEVFSGDIPIASPTDENPLALASVTEEKIQQSHIADDVEYCGKFFPDTFFSYSLQQFLTIFVSLSRRIEPVCQ